MTTLQLTIICLACLMVGACLGYTVCCLLTMRKLDEQAETFNAWCKRCGGKG